VSLKLNALGSIDFIGSFCCRQIPLSPQQNPKRLFRVFLFSKTSKVCFCKCIENKKNKRQFSRRLGYVTRLTSLGTTELIL